jgi:hypothetical protein
MDLNIVGSGLTWTNGDIFLDPVSKIEDAKYEVLTIGASYIRTFELFGKSSRIDFLVPFSEGSWQGNVNGQFESTKRTGFNDPRIRFSTILYGAPPLKGKEFMAYVQSNPVNTSVGFGLSVSLPVGEYFPDRLINLGGNRFVIRPQLGVLHQHRGWQFEVTGTLSFYMDNDEYLGASNLEQDPMLFTEGHIIRTFPRGKWLSLSAGFSAGGESQVNGRDLGNDDRTRYVALSYGMPISKTQSIKFAWLESDTNVLIGSRNSTLNFSWSMNWGR